MVFPNSEKWQLLLKADPKKVNKASLQIQYAVQFIAILGKYYLDEIPDDSHTSAEWLGDHNFLAGKWIKGKKLFRLALDIRNFRLIFLDNEINEISSINLNGKKQKEIFDWIKTEISNLGKDNNLLQMNMHYEIPDSEIAHDKPFQSPPKTILEELSKLRHNADLILRFIASKFKNSEPVRLWPHHFDTGTLFSVKKSENGDLLKSIGLGMAIPDNIANEYYFYVSPWNSNGKINFDTLPDLNNNGKWHIHGWNGAYLPVSEIITAETKEKQAEIVNGFLFSAIDACLFLLDSTELFSTK